MKRLAFLFAAALLASCSTLAIYMDTTTSQGERKLATTKLPLANCESGKVYLSLGVMLSKADTLMGILAICDAPTGHGIFNKGYAMKFRLNDDSEITLFNQFDKRFETHQETHVEEHYETAIGIPYVYGPYCRPYYVRPYQVVAMVPEVYTTQESLSYGLYLITYPELQDIVNKGVKKMRIELETSDLDLDGDKAGKVPDMLKGMFECLVERVKGTPVRSEF